MNLLKLSMKRERECIGELAGGGELQVAVIVSSGTGFIKSGRERRERDEKKINTWDPRNPLICDKLTAAKCSTRALNVE